MTKTLKPLTVQADPIWTGKHPYHEYRFITTEGDRLVKLDPIFPHDDPDRIGFEDGTQGASLICTMTDCQDQKEYAKLFAASPDLLEACRAALHDMTELDGTPLPGVCPATYQKLASAISKAS